MCLDVRGPQHDGRIFRRGKGCTLGARGLDSLEAAETTQDESLDFVYIDADHSYKSCMLDIIAWESKVRHGGIISGHDYFDDFENGFGVKSAVDRLYGEDIHVTDEKELYYGRICNSWYLEKNW